MCEMSCILWTVPGAADDELDISPGVHGVDNANSIVSRKME